MNLLREFMKLPTTVEDIFKIAGKQCNVFSYNELANFNDIDDLFIMGNSEQEMMHDIGLPFDDNTAIILYESEPNFGHWTMITKNDYGYNFLDSYGDTIDGELDYIDDDYKVKSGQDKKFLVNLLINAGEDVYYNNTKLQKLNNDIATCGLYCAQYLKHNDMNVDDFAKLIKKLSGKHKFTPDEVIAIMSL